MKKDNLNNEVSNSESQAKPIIIKKDNTWKLILIVICICIFIYGLIFSNIKSPNIPYIMGLYLLYSIIIASILYYAIVRRKERGEALMSFLAIYLSFIISGTIAGYINEHKLRRESKQFVNMLEDKYKRLFEQSLPQSSPKNEGSIDAVSKSNKLFSEVDRWINENTNRLYTLRKDYFYVVDKIGWNNILSPVRIQNDKELAESRNVIKRAKETVDRYALLFDKWFDDSFSGIDNMKIDESYKIELKKGYKDSADITRSMIKRFWQLELNCVLEVEKGIDYLSENRDSWLISNNQIHFMNENDLNAYNEYLSNVQKYVKEQELINQEIADKAQKNLANLKNILK